MIEPARLLIEDHGIIGNTCSCALVDRRGSINWLCLPRFDSAALFARLLGNDDNGVWELAPEDPGARMSRRYRPHTAILETTFETATGVVTLIDFMPGPGSERQNVLIRIVRGVKGTVAMRTRMLFRFEYGQRTPWLNRTDDGVMAVAGPDALRVATPVELENQDFATRGRFVVGEGEQLPFELIWFPSHLEAPPSVDPIAELRRTEQVWRAWQSTGCYQDHGQAEAIERSLITLKLLTYAPTGGIVAAPTTSLPEALGGVRNWDYRYCWIRDAAYTLVAFLSCGHREESLGFRRWMLRAVAGTPRDVQIMYGLHGERHLPEHEIPWLAGYEDSRPVRTGNGAATQIQLDIYGELLGAIHTANRHGIDGLKKSWSMLRLLIDALAERWSEPDEGIWEIRGVPRHFVHSKVMAWSAVNSAIALAEEHHLDAPLDDWRAMRETIREDVLTKGYDPVRNTFVQCYGSREVDAALLTITTVGFLPADDPRMAGTIAAIEQDLLVDGFVMRYRESAGVDGLPPGEGSFLACSFWLVQAYAYVGRIDDARLLFDRLLAVRNDLGLLAEEYEPRAGRQLGNFPQAFSHVGLINAAMAIERIDAPAAPT